jgi:RNA polymerase sigma factor (sigma-70 family)
MDQKVYYLGVASAETKFRLISVGNHQHSTQRMSFESNTKYLPFGVTQWSLVQCATSASSPERDAALNALCAAYWPPLYGFVRKSGYKREEAQDITQAFFERLLDKNYLADVDPRKGKFRSFLIAYIKNFLRNYRRDSLAQKRGGGASFISFDEGFDESLCLNNPAFHVSNPEDFYQAQWAAAVFGQALIRLRTEFLKTQSEALYKDLHLAITYTDIEASYADIAKKHGTTATAIKQLVRNWRQRVGKYLRAELANTGSTPEEVEDEMHALFAVYNEK